MYLFMYYITIKVTLPVSGLGVICIFNLIYIIIVYLMLVHFDPGGSVYTMGDRFV